MKHITYLPVGTCSRRIDIDIDENGLIHDVNFVGGCNGNLKGICSLLTVYNAVQKGRVVRTSCAVPWNRSNCKKG